MIGIVDVEFERELYIHKHEVSDDIISNERVRDSTLAGIFDIRVITKSTFTKRSLGAIF